MVTEDQVKEFQEIYKSITNKNISTKDAYDQGIKLVNFFKVILSKR